jgi:hypothetical protein
MARNIRRLSSSTLSLATRKCDSRVLEPPKLNSTRTCSGSFSFLYAIARQGDPDMRAYAGAARREIAVRPRQDFRKPVTRFPRKIPLDRTPVHSAVDRLVPTLGRRAFGWQPYWPAAPKPEFLSAVLELRKVMTQIRVILRAARRPRKPCVRRADARDAPLRFA